MVQRTSQQGSSVVGHHGSERTSHSYYVVMIDYGRSYVGKKGPSGFQAVVDPEHTRGKIIDLIAKGEWENIEFIHEIADGRAVDVTAELIEAALELEAA